MGNETKILFVSDIHGSEVVFRKALNAAKMFSVDYLILGGDLVSKDFALYLKNGNSIYLGEKEVSLDEIEKAYKNSGLAPLFFESKDELDEFHSNQQFRREKILDFIQGQIDSWIKIFEEKTKNTKFKTIWNTGNDDPLEVDSYLERYGIKVAENELIEINDLIMISSGYVNPTPWNTYRELPESTLYNKLMDKITKLENPEFAIFNFHAPPYNTKLDIANMNSKNIHVGSQTVRELIEKYQPLLGLHGHIHESSNIDKIRNTMVVNPGSNYKDGILNYALIVIKKESKGFGRAYIKKFEVKSVILGRG
ncbi:phosphoesterase [Sulfolobus sp. S-194]|uniref:metallophosphoesterase family protein n=1 Tax=Sulfolobus sp. S-194 TaxID=2512240 RepID=UPI001436E727|nr:metallophosphoesterase [Sulfolobus sp. S-194]QIW23969.1 phosphoesterase [Sulfolobus sp. S-194]